LGGLAALGSTLVNPIETFAGTNDIAINSINKKAKNIIFMVSDGMSAGTLNMANMYSERILGKTSNWIQLYNENKVIRKLIDMAYSYSIVTNSAASSTS